MSKKESTKHALLLNQALNTIGVETVLEHYDGHKHVDIFVPAAKLCIEVDGSNHYTSATQIVADCKRAEHSAEDGFHTFRVPNNEIEKEVMKVARAIQKVTNEKAVSE